MCVCHHNQHSSTLGKRLQKPNSDVGPVRRWVVWTMVRSRFWLPCTAVSSQNEELLNQLVHANRRITSGELCTESIVGFIALDKMLAALGYRKVCARRVPRILTQEHKDHGMRVCQDLLESPTTPHSIVQIWRLLTSICSGEQHSTYNDVIAALRKWVSSVGTDFYERRLLFIDGKNAWRVVVTM
jgi:hypothetical protein